MKKKLGLSMLVLSLLGNVVYAEEHIKIKYNLGEKFIESKEAFIEKNRTFLPAREVVKILGGEINWNSTNREVNIKNKNKDILMKIDDNKVLVNNKPIKLDTNAEIRGGTTYIPIRFVSEVLGYNVSWDGERKEIHILEDSKAGHGELSSEELKLAKLINEYRKSQGKKELKISKSLTKVARLHSIDQQYNYKNKLDYRGIKGNLHSWSENGPWSPVVYTPDNKYCELMWNKPREITSYPGNGYEVTYWNSNKATAEKALNSWRNSRDHNNVISSNGQWHDLNVMGVSVYKNYSNVWFGVEEDPEGYYSLD